MRSSVVFVSLGIAMMIAVNGCGGSSSGGGTGGAGGTTGDASATGDGGVGGHGGGSAGTAGGGAAGTGGAPACVNVVATNSGETCNVIATGGTCVTATVSTAAAPTPAGGAFADGTYNLVSQTFYVSPGTIIALGIPIRRTYVLSDITPTSFTLDLVETLGTGVARAHQTAAVSGMTATFTQICPATDGGSDWGGSDDFTATSSSITLFRSTNGVVEVTVYDKTP